MRGVGFTQHLWMNFGFLDELRLLTGRDVPEYYRSLLNPSYIPADLEDRRPLRPPRTPRADVPATGQRGLGPSTVRAPRRF